jgi:phage repressor protein C with HTH and peptisase S24 domain
MEMNGKLVSLSELVDTDDAEFEVVRRGKNTGWFITLGGPGHERTLAAQAITNRRALRRQQQIEAATINGRKYKPVEGDPEEDRRHTIESIAARVIGWRGLSDGNGGELRYSPEEAMKILSDPHMGWLLGQVADQITDERFFSNVSEKP